MLADLYAILHKLQQLWRVCSSSFLNGVQHPIKRSIDPMDIIDIVECGFFEMIKEAL